ncbi:DUF5333 domain-containing protein [Shimia sp. W99]
MTRFATAIVIATAIATSAGFASAKPPLREVREIDDKIYYGLVAYVLAEECDSLSARKLKGINDLWTLGRRARELGYSDEEIKAYIRSKDEKARMRARGDAWLKSKGVSLDDQEAVCALGRAEIERNSAIGVYLRAN